MNFIFSSANYNGARTKKGTGRKNCSEDKEIKMKKAVKTISLLTAMLSLMLFSAIAYYDGILPDSYCYEQGKGLSFESVKYITASEGGEYPVSATDKSRDVRLMLMGIFPVKTVEASSSQPPVVMSGGMPFGIKLTAGGAVVIDFFEIDGRCPAKECGLREGDIIISSGGEAVNSNQQFADTVMKSRGNPIELIISRDGERKSLHLSPVEDDGTYKAGVEVRDSSAGIGTVTFYDPVCKMFAGLGHAVCDSVTGEIFPCGRGEVAPVEITGVRKSKNGEPGELLGIFSGSSSTGTITLNCERGVYGALSISPKDSDLYPIAFKQDIKTGEAYIISTLDGEGPKEYSVTIESIDLSGDSTKNMVIRVTDEELLRKAGGIVQGMSGSPIIQDGKLVGAVTHVFVKDTRSGYATFAEDMYNQMLSCRAQEGLSETLAFAS